METLRLLTSIQHGAEGLSGFARVLAGAGTQEPVGRSQPPGG